MAMLALRSSGVLVVLGACSLPLGAQKGIPEPRAGVEFKPPKGWVELPAGGDRGATLRLFAAPRALAGKADEATHTPLLRVMFFKKGGDASKDVVDGLPRQTPFRSLEDFAQRGRGSKDVSHEAGKAGTFECQRVTAKIPAGDHVLIGAAMALDDGECAVCFEYLANHAEKVKKDAEATLGSLASCARAAAPRIEPPWVDASWAGKDAAARTAARRKWADDVVAAAAKTPEAGFKVQKSKYWTVLSNADPAYTKKAIAAAEAMRGWCEKKVPELTKEPPLAAVLRIFDSQDHYAAFQSTLTDQRDYDSRRRELYVVDNPDEGGATGYVNLFQTVLWQVFDDVDPGVLPALPRWFDNGCNGFMYGSKFDGKKLEFASSDNEKGRMVWYGQNGKPMPDLWSLIQEQWQPSPTDGSSEPFWGYRPDCARLMRWFWSYDGLKAFDKPTLVGDYVRGIAAAFAQLGPDPTADVATIGLSEAQQKEANTRHYKWRDALLKQVNDTVLPLQVDAWKAVNEKWLEFNKNFK